MTTTIRRRLAALASDLGTLAPVRRLVSLATFQFLLVVPTLVLVAIVVTSAAVGLEHPSVNFGAVVTWVVWWGALLASLVVLGRAWCLLCPLGAVAEWLQRLSLWWPSRVTPGLGLRWPRQLRGMWLATGLFVLFVFADNGYGMSNSPRMTAGLIAVIALAAAWVGFVFERRTFCRYLCPLTSLIGLGALVSALELRRRDPAVCARCATKGCYAGNAGHWGCPMGEFPGAMDENLNCILCTECLRACPAGNLTLRLRPPGQDLWAMRRARVDVAVSAVVIAGLATLVPVLTLGWLPPLRALLSRVLPAGAPPNDPPRLVAIALLLALGMVTALGLVAGACRLGAWAADGVVTTRAAFSRYAVALVPIALGRMLADLADHALRTWGALAHVTQALWLDFPLNRVMPGQVTVNHLAGPVEVYALQVGLLLAGLGLTLFAMHRVSLRLAADRDAALASLLPVAGLAVVLTLTSVWTLGMGV